MIYLGIDPGKSGGVVTLWENSEFAAPKVDKMPDPAGLLALLKDAASCPTANEDGVICALELVHSMPHDGRSSLWKFARHYGHIEMALMAAKIPYRYVRPLEWQDEFDCRTGGDKRVSKAKAQELFPDIKVTHAVADALLLAEYARRNF